MFRPDLPLHPLVPSVIALVLSSFLALRSAWPTPPPTEAQLPVDQYGVQTALATPAEPLVEAASAAIKTGEEISSIPKKIQYAFRLNLRQVYDDNIFLIQGQHVGDFYLAIEPGLTLGYGDIVGASRNYIQLDYAPSFILYADHSGANSIQQLVRLMGAYRLGHLNMSLSQDVQILHGTNPASLSSLGSSNTAPAVNLDTGGGTDQNTYTTNGNFSYDLTGKTFLSGALNYSRNDYQNLIGSQTISGNLFINYNYSPKLVVGLGGTAGYNWVESTNPDQTFEQINGNMTYQLTGKVNLNANVGVEFREFDGNSSGANISPVYALSASYQPFDGTTLSLSGNRRIQNSAVLAGQDYSSTNLTLNVRQRLLRRFYLGVVTGYENSDYFSTVSGTDASRSDNYFFVQPSVDVTITRYWTAGFYYLHRQSDSSFESFSFYDNQYGLRTSLAF